MTKLVWSELYPPRQLKLAAVTALVRVLGGRPRFGLRGLQPVVVFELWISAEGVRWLVGCDERVARHQPGELTAQVPGLSASSLKASPRARPATARVVRLSSLAYPLRLDTAASVANGLFHVRQRLGKQEAVVVQWSIGPSHRPFQRPAPSLLEQLGLLPVTKTTGNDKAAWQAKISEPLFDVHGRVGAQATDPKRAAQLIGPAISALGLAADSQARVMASRQSSRVAERLFRVVGRVQWYSSIVNAAELAVMLGFPVDGAQAPGGDSLDLATAPHSLLVPADKPERAQGDRLIGVSLHPRDEGALVRLPLKSSTSNIHLISPIGGGKSTLIANWIKSDAEAGRSIFVLEPKADLVTDVLKILPSSRHGDLVVIEPGNYHYPVIGLNPLAGPTEEAERRADSMLGSFKSVFGNAIGPRSTDLLVHTLIMAARLEDGTLTDVPTILTNAAFRRRVLRAVSDPLIISPWAAGFDSLSDEQRRQAVMPVLNKLRAFLSRAPLRRMLCQAKPLFTFDELFTSPKIVLISLNAGLIGPETNKLIGSVILEQFWQAVQRQARVPQDQRRPVMAAVDELPEFTAGLDFAEVLARSRGMNVSFTVSHQNAVGQLSPNLRAALYANARNRISWRPAKDDQRALAEVFGIEAATLGKLPAYHAVASVLVDGAPSPAFGVKTLPLPPAINDPDALRAASARRYGVDPDQLDQALVERWRGGEDQSGESVGMRRLG